MNFGWLTSRSASVILSRRGRATRAEISIPLPFAVGAADPSCSGEAALFESVK